MSTNPTLAGILLGNLSNPDLEINLTNKEATYLKELIVEYPEILYKIYVIITRVTKITGYSTIYFTDFGCFQIECFRTFDRKYKYFQFS